MKHSKMESKNFKKKKWKNKEQKDGEKSALTISELGKRPKYFNFRKEFY